MTVEFTKLKKDNDTLRTQLAARDKLLAEAKKKLETWMPIHPKKSKDAQAVRGYYRTVNK